MNDEYFQWLVERIRNGMDDIYRKNKKVLKLLWDTPFHSALRMDKNRVDDAAALREEFAANTHYIFSKWFNTLEVLVALADRMGYNIMTIDERIPNASFCFWEMIDNLGFSLNELDNAYILDSFLDRTYEKNGKGGIFPLKRKGRDQTKVELWYQMMSYINENFS